MSDSRARGCGIVNFKSEQTSIVSSPLNCYFINKAYPISERSGVKVTIDP